jgi:hypothetical protein
VFCVLGRSVLITNIDGDIRFNQYWLVFLIIKDQQSKEQTINGRDVFKMELKFNTFKP